MLNIFKIIIFSYFIIFGFSNISYSKDLTKQHPIEKTIYFKGVSGEYHYYEPSKLILQAGRLYKLILINNSDSKHYFSSNSFSKSIFTRKVQIASNTSKIAEVKGIINEVEIWPNQQIEWWFVPIKTGRFKDLLCKVKDKKNDLSHHEMGMKGTIIIE